MKALKALEAFKPSAHYVWIGFFTQPAFTCSELTTKTLEQVVKYVQS